MFAAGRKLASPDADADAGSNANDWLSVGKSFSGGKSEDPSKTKHDAAESESALQVSKHRHNKHRHKEKKRYKEKKRRSEESTAVASRESRHLKKKSKDKKRRRSWSRSNSSDDDEERRRSSHRSRRRRHRSRSNSRSRSQLRCHKETRIAKQTAKDVAVCGQNAGKESEKLFEFDCVGDRENQFFGSTSEGSGKEKNSQDTGRYFSPQARKLERNARQKRLYLAYSEKRLSRVAAEDGMDQPDHRLPEITYIPLDPVLDVGDMVTGGRGSGESHLELLRTFALRWNKDDAIGFGDETVSRIETLADAPKPSLVQLQDFIQKTCVTAVDQVNPPEVLRTEVHRQSLLSASAAYQRQSRRSDATEKNSEINSNDASSDESETESRRGGKVIYSNLHGYRINVDDANDSKEYERILAELRGTENARARQTQLLDKEKLKRAVLAETHSQLEDQRANYDSIDGDDRFLQWLNREEVQIQEQWAPLRSNNPLHQDLIEDQPDRVTLTEELQPFLFSVPKAYQWRLIAEILQMCGVEWRGEFSWESSLPGCESMYSDGSAGYELLVAPILSVLNPDVANSSKHKLFLDPSDRKMLLESALLKDIAVKRGVVCDPSKVAFIRRVFAQAVDTFHETDEKFESALKCLWIGFEAEVIRALGASEESIASKKGDTDFTALYAYAKLELTLGNERQVRRICANTLKSLASPSVNTQSERDFHRFAFLQARLELWSSSGERKKNNEKAQNRLLRCLYTLWSARQLDNTEKESLETITKKHKSRTNDYLQELLISNPSTTSCREYRQTLANAEHQSCSHVSWMWTCFLDFMQQHQVSGVAPSLAPREWRSSIGEAVEKFSTNKLFLRLFVDAETGNTISQVLRNYFLRVEKRWRRHFDSPELVEWLFALLCEFYRDERAATTRELSKSSVDEVCCLNHRWGMNATAVNRIRQMFESMVNQIRTKGNALCWGLYMRFEVALGKVDAAKKVLYRGIAACAWSKALYMDGLRALRPYLSEDECQELIEFMEAKELNLRVDFE
ncbi:hypothetical protein PInf_019447 [Phytophthora infestans]|nr:hypothetical protein PInf_019447 [Phytophthora infestans]